MGSCISIHALLAESDVRFVQLCQGGIQFLSTLSLRRATSTNPKDRERRSISIHALLAESDDMRSHNRRLNQEFLSTLSLRRATAGVSIRCVALVIFLSTLSLRRATLASGINPDQSGFLSTLSLRRATLFYYFFALCYVISIHALLAESDNIPPDSVLIIDISIHALLAESDRQSGSSRGLRGKFLSTLSLRRATGRRKLKKIQKL